MGSQRLCDKQLTKGPIGSLVTGNSQVISSTITTPFVASCVPRWCSSEYILYMHLLHIGCTCTLSCVRWMYRLHFSIHGYPDYQWSIHCIRLYCTCRLWPPATSFLPPTLMHSPARLFKSLVTPHHICECFPRQGRSRVPANTWQNSTHTWLQDCA